MKSNHKKWLPLLIFVPASSVLAQQSGSDRNHLAMDVNATTEYTDNATKQEVDENKISERQDIYNLGVNAGYTNDWLMLGTAYDAYKMVFEKDSQPDYSYLEGSSSLTLGNPYQPVNLLLSHSRRSVLGTPDAVDLTTNRDQRDIITAQPMVKWHFTDADLLLLRGYWSEVSFRENADKKSNQSGGEISWVRSITKVDELQVIYQQNKTSFSKFPSADYDYQSLMARYSANLNHFSYMVQVGRDSAKPESQKDSYSKPSYRVEASYDTGINTFKAIGSQTISNSSVGDGNSLGLGSGGMSGNSQNIDLMTLSKIELSWLNRGLCARCTLTLGVSSGREDYKVLAEDGHNTSVSAGLSYKFARAATLGLTLSHHDKNFATNSSLNAYTSDNAKLSFGYDFQNDLSLRVYQEFEKRDSTKANARKYDENITGLNLSYRF
jgi:hypothetical protein